MGLIAAGLNAVGGTLASQWKEYFYVDALPDDVLVTKAGKKVKGRFGGSRYEDDNVISDGSVIAVNDGQCMMIVDQGRIVDFCAEPGEYVFDQNGEPSIFYGELNGEKLKAILKTTFDRLSFGGQAGRDTHVYFFNTKRLSATSMERPAPCPSAWWTATLAWIWTSPSAALANTAIASPTRCCFTSTSVATWRATTPASRSTASSRASC